MHDKAWIWQHPNWPNFSWQLDRLAPLLRSCTQTQGRLLGMVGAVDSDAAAQNKLDALMQNIIKSSAIEGEQLDAGAVRSSIARFLGLADSGNPTPRSEGLASLLMDATSGNHQPLNMQRLLAWHVLLFPQDASPVTAGIRIGQLRGEELMQVISGRLDSPTVHFEAPHRANLELELASFLDWFESSRDKSSLDPFLRAGIAHFWFVTLHPFDDGNGRMTRVLTDMALAQGELQAIRFYAMSASIFENRASYYRILETSQKGDLDITDWLEWFLITLLKSLEQALFRIDRTLTTSRFWQKHREASLSAEQMKVLNRLLNGGEKGFELGISAAQYQAVAQVSKATATRHLSDLLEKSCLRRLPGGGRSTRYQINHPGRALPATYTDTE